MFEKHLPILRKSALFQDFGDEDILQILVYMNASERIFHKGEIISHAGEKITLGAIVVEGHIDAIEEDFWGNEVLFGRFYPGELFGIVFVWTQKMAFPFTAYAYRTTTLLYVDYLRVLQASSENHPWYPQLLHNYLAVFADKTIILLEKLSHVTRHTLREKLLSYLSAQALTAGSNTFTLSFNRQELANYLAVDRSALSSELSRMQKEGLISYTKNTFELHEKKES